MKKAVFMIVVTLFLATIAHGNGLGKIYTSWTITIDIKPEQSTDQIAMNGHEIKIETIYNPYFDFRTNRIRLSLHSEIYMDGIQVWEGYTGSKVKCTALKTGDVMIVVDEKKIWPSEP